MGNHLLPIMDEDKDTRPKFRGGVEMPVLLGSDDPAHNVTILDQAGKAIEWNGEDYVEAGTEVEQAQQSRDGKDEERDSDQYLESDDSTLRKSGNRDSADDFTSDTEAPLELKRTVGLFSWVSTMIIKPSQLAIICMSFAAYSVEAFAYECAPDPFIIQLTAAST